AGEHVGSVGMNEAALVQRLGNVQLAAEGIEISDALFQINHIDQAVRYPFFLDIPVPWMTGLALRAGSQFAAQRFSPLALARAQAMMKGIASRAASRKRARVRPLIMTCPP